MKKIIYFLMILLLALIVTACTSAPNGSTSTGITPEQQRKNAREAQNELSKDVNKGER